MLQPRINLDWVETNGRERVGNLIRNVMVAGIALVGVGVVRWFFDVTMLRVNAGAVEFMLTFVPGTLLIVIATFTLMSPANSSLRLLQNWRRWLASALVGGVLCVAGVMWIFGMPGFIIGSGVFLVGASIMCRFLFNVGILLATLEARGE